jgi:iron complex transport system substrate-binding protein
VRERLQTQKALYTLDEETLERVRPDLLVTQALCDVCAVAEAEVAEAACRLPGMPRVLNLEPMSLEDVYTTLEIVGTATNRREQARDVVCRMQERVAQVETRTAAIPYADRPRVVFLEWIDPPFPGGHWTPALIAMAGGLDVLGQPAQPSRTTSWARIVGAQPEALFVACCGFDTERGLQDLPLLQAQPGWSDLPCVQNGRVYFTDGNAYFNRPGPRLVDSLEILAHALHPAIHPLPPHLAPAVRLPDADGS